MVNSSGLSGGWSCVGMNRVNYFCELCGEVVNFCPALFLENPRLRLFLVLSMTFSCLAVNIQPGTILPMGNLNTYPTLYNPGYPYSAIIGPHHCGGYPTPYIYKCPGVWLPQLG